MARPHEHTSAISPLIGFAIAVAVLYFARDLLIPFAFALLIAFLLSPIVKRIEAFHVHRVPAALLVFLVASALVAVVGWVVTNQLIQIVESLPRYSDNVRRKLGALEGKSKGLSDVISNLEDMGKLTGSARPGDDREPMRVQVVEQQNIVQTVRNYAAGLLKPIGTVVLIMVFTIFMLIDREGLRNRLLRLMGQQKLQATTKAMDDAGQRVSRYVLLQFAVNAGFGSIIAIGLFFIGVPSYMLWGVLGIFLRFLPYIGPAIAGFLPFALALAVSDGWRTPLLVVGLFIGYRRHYRQLRRTSALWRAYRSFRCRHSGFGGVLDGLVGSHWPGPLNAADRLPERCGPPFATTGIPEHRTGRRAGSDAPRSFFISGCWRSISRTR